MECTALRVGVLTPHAAAGPEAALPDMTSDPSAAWVARTRPPGPEAAVRLPPSTPSELRSLTHGPALHQAAASIRDEQVHAVAHASTSTSYALGHRAEAELVERLRQLCGAPVVASGSSAVAALSSCQSRGAGVGRR